MCIDYLKIRAKINKTRKTEERKDNLRVLKINK
jgi:hypothetical protein